MVATSLLLSLVSLLTLARAKPATHNLVIHEHRETIPQGFVHIEAALGTAPLNLRIALVSNDMAGLEKALYDVSTPSSESYGQHLTKEEVEEFVAPSLETTTAVNEWLTANGLQSSPISPAGDWLSVSLDVKTANEIFDADFTVYTHQATGKQSIRTLSYSIPASLKDHIELVHPTIAFPVHIGVRPAMASPLPAKTNLSSDVTPSSCADGATPTCLQNLYGLPASAPAYTKSRIVVSAFEEAYAQEKDLSTFLKAFRPDLSPATTFTLATLDGGINPQNASLGFEHVVTASLDTQYTIGVAGGVPVTYISVGSKDRDVIHGFLDTVNYLISRRSPPQVWTTSYDFDEHDVPLSIAKTLCNAYMQLGARGVSIFFSPGTSLPGNSKPTSFIPSFPSVCPFVTSVGTTILTSPEYAAGSTGGFSNIFAAPSYQTSAVSAFLTKFGNTSSHNFDRTGRAYPDIAARTNVVIFIKGQRANLFGAEPPSKIVASTIALLNAELMAAGKSALGFLNPFIYANPGAFADITKTVSLDSNFPPAAGWDPVTGFGSPRYAALRKAVGLCR